MADKAQAENSVKDSSGPAKQIATNEGLAVEMAESATDAIARHPLNLEANGRILHDLKLDIVKAAARLCGEASERPANDELLWNLASELPDFNLEAYYQKRTSLAALAVAVALGWVLGGLVSAFLGFFGLGGDILRAAAIFGLLWLNDYFGAHPRARRVFLTMLGLGGLARFAGAAAAGVIRFSGMGTVRRLIFGASGKTGFFKSIWLFFGAIFVFIFLAKKVTALDLGALRQGLEERIAQLLRLSGFVLKEISSREAALADCERRGGSTVEIDACRKRSRQLASAVFSIIDSLEPEKRAFLAEKLDNAGFRASGEIADNVLIWNNEEHAKLYETIGIVRDGDRCRILKRPYMLDGKLVKGHVQRIPE